VIRFENVSMTYTGQQRAALDLPPYRIEVTSALRTAEHQARLRGSNANAAAGTSSPAGAKTKAAGNNDLGIEDQAHGLPRYRNQNRRLGRVAPPTAG